MKKIYITSLMIFITVTAYSQLESDEIKIRDIVSDLAQAWTESDGQRFASHFADDHDFFVWNGLYSPDLSVEQNAAGHQAIFDSQYKNTHHYAVVDKVRFVTNDVAVVIAMSAIVPKGQVAPEHPQVLWSATMLKKKNKWKIVSFHNADIEILDNAVSRANSPIPVEVMYRNWYSSNIHQNKKS